MEVAQETVLRVHHTLIPESPCQANQGRAGKASTQCLFLTYVPISIVLFPSLLGALLS